VGTDEQRTTLLLVSGRFRLELSVGSFVLENEGDYALRDRAAITTGMPRRTRLLSPYAGRLSVAPRIRVGAARGREKLING
jgi:hypothetical protein